MRIRSFWTQLAVASVFVAACDGGGGTDAGSQPDADTPSCPTGTQECGDVCVDTSGDRDHCGACGNACAAGEACIDGACDVLCPASQVLCGDACVDLTTDRRHCGACDAACGSGEICAGSACEISCPPDQIVCDGACVDTTSDPAHCGACGAACEAGEVCSESACAASCGATLMECGAACVDTQNSPDHCGACDTACAGDTAATGLCSAGSCRVVCDVLYGDCNVDLGASGDGCETPLATDPANCGACNRVCSAPNGVPGCVDGGCTVVGCVTGFGDCDADTSTGCETNVRFDDANCGACGTACGAGERCFAGACRPNVGEDCSDAVTLARGTNTVVWTATTADFLTSPPSCSTQALTGPDVVLRYTATGNEQVTLSFDKPASQRWSAVVSTEACGLVTPELTCLSELTNPELTGTFSLSAGSTAHVYLRDTTSGSLPLSNPLEVTLAAIDCATDPPPSAVELSPPSAGIARVDATFRVRFDGVVDTTTGAVTITGDMGTALSYDLSTSPAEISFSVADTVLEIDPGVTFPPGELLTIALSGLQGGVCAGGAAITSPAWTVTVTTPTCMPGVGGVVGTATTRLPGPVFGTEYHVVADDDPSGYVYVGGTADLQRIPKAGGAAEDVYALAGLTSTNLGYAMVIAGQSIFTIDTAIGTSGRVYRISSDGGATWLVEDYASFATAPADDFRAAAAYGGRIYLLTEEDTSGVPTEIWSVDASAAAPAPARLELSFGGDGDCNALERDSTYFYVGCSESDRILRMPAAGGTPEIVSDGVNFNTTVNALAGADLDGDGVYDVLYAQPYTAEVFYVCDPSGVAPFTASLLDLLGGTTTNYGLGFDRGANTLWMFDDDTEEFVSIR